MGVRGVFARLAAGAPVPVFVLAAMGGRERVRRLALSERVELVDSPRAATVLLVVGRLPPSLWDAARQVHDQMGAPRSTVVWDDQPLPALPLSSLVATVDDPMAALTAPMAHEGHLLADEDPNPWRGVGPYGQGGTGMTGGTPYGRPLTGRAEDRDGLQLDQLPVTVGPFFPALPPGLVLHLKLQGDVVQEATVGDNPFAQDPGDPPVPGGSLAIFERALAEPVAVADLELARARHHLWWLGDALRLHGLPAMGERSWRLAAGLRSADGRAVARLAAAVRRSQVLRWSVRGVAPTDPSSVSERGMGPVARAAGRPEDARQLDPAYAALGFAPVVQWAPADAAARWRQRMAEIEQALDLAQRADGARTTPVGVVEAPRGCIVAGAAAPSASLMGMAGRLVTGLEWGDAVAAIASLDLDVEEAARTVARPVQA